MVVSEGLSVSTGVKEGGLGPSSAGKIEFSEIQER